MSDKFHRRGFIERITLAMSALIVKPVMGLTKTLYKDRENNNKTMIEEKNPVKNVKAMGFVWETADPFLFCVHHEDKFPKGNEKMGPIGALNGRNLGDDFIIKDGFRMYHGKVIPGFPGHPHRGFETITVVREGIVDHADSMGAAGRYGNGDVQWLTVGKGVQHSEMFPLIHEDKENPMELFQIWLNLPKKDKMVDAHFKMLWSDTIPKLVSKDNLGKVTEVEIIAGTLSTNIAPLPPPNSWAANTNNEVAIWNIKIEAGGKCTLPKASAGINRMLYFYIGDSITIGKSSIRGYCSVEVEPDIDLEILNGNTEARILVLQGKPIGEPVIQYGPFVMNTKEEINQAFEDYHKTQFGGWPWPKSDQVHDRKSSRFALHADGTKEIKS